MHNLVQMAHAKDKRPAEISGGMKERVGLVRALAMEPKVYGFVRGLTDLSWMRDARRIAHTGQ
jgi:ABC-type Fe3+/spermidine/putrescine transport system ATPase subunit